MHCRSYVQLRQYGSRLVVINEKLTLAGAESDAVRAGFRKTERTLVALSSIMGFSSNHDRVKLFREWCILLR